MVKTFDIPVCRTDEQNFLSMPLYYNSGERAYENDVEKSNDTLQRCELHHRVRLSHQLTLSKDKCLKKKRHFETTDRKTTYALTDQTMSLEIRLL